MQRSDNLNGLHHDPRAHCRDGRIRITDSMPALGNLILLVGQINAVTCVDPHLGHAIGRNNNCLTNLKGASQLYDCFFTMLRIEVTE